MTKSQSPNQGRRNRTAWTISLLLAATLAVGAATQHRRDGVDAISSNTFATTGQGFPMALSGQLDRSAVMLGGDGLVRMELVLEGEDRITQTALRQPTDLVVVLDRSGSMQGQKITDAHAAVRQLVSQLGSDDRFALVAFESNSQLAIPLAHATPQAAAQWNRRIDRIGAGGGTQMAPALDMAFDTIESARASGRTPRIILISDGRAGEPDDVLIQQAVRAARGEFALSTVGVGTDFNESLMAHLSDAGTGNYYYLADSADLAEVFTDEFESAQETVAAGLVVKIQPAPGVSVLEASGYPLEPAANGVAFRPGALYAGQRRHVWVTFRVPTGAEATHSLGGVEVAYNDRGQSRSIALDELPQVATVRAEEDFFASLDVETWEQSVVVEEYNDLSKKVSDYVREGRREDARREVDAFVSRNRALNRVAASPVVADQIAESEALAASIEGAFVGPDQVRKQNLLGKELHADAYDKRRKGSRK